MSTPKLSIVITFCNQSEYISKLLDSILSQETEYTYEVIIGLDGACDISERIILKYIEEHSNFKLFRLSSSSTLIPLSRASTNRLFLAQKTSGEYITFMDGDDFYIDNSRFQKLILILDGHYDYIGAAHSHRLYDHQNAIFKSIISPYSHNKLIRLESFLKEEKYLFSNDIIFRNIFRYTNITYIDRLYLNDTTLTLWFLTYGKIFFITTPMLGYRINIPSIYSGKKVIEKK